MTPPDPLRIDIDDPSQLQYWSQKLDVSEQSLCDAVNTVGADLAAVEMHLKGSHSTANSELVQAVEQGGKLSEK
jgi:hypothetical protein